MQNSFERLGGGAQGLGYDIERIAFDLQSVQDIHERLSKASQTLIAYKKSEDRLCSDQLIDDILNLHSRQKHEAVLYEEPSAALLLNGVEKRKLILQRLCERVRGGAGLLRGRRVDHH